GALVFRPARPLAGADQRILERAAQVTALLLLFRSTVAEAEGQVRGELLDDLVGRPVTDPDALRARAGLAVARDGRVALLLTGADAGDLARQVARELGRALDRPVTAGAAGPVRGPQAVAAAYREAGLCVTALVALGRSGEGAGAAGLGYVGLLLGEQRDV